MRFRLFLIGCTALCLAVLLRLSVHVSFHARVLGRYSIPYFGLLVGFAAVTVGTVGFHHPFFYRRLHRVRWPLVLGLSTTVMLLAAAEISVRVFDPFGISHFEESSRLWLDYVSDPVLVFRLPPHTQKTYQGVMISTNGLGFRDRELERKQNGELRILLLGDSITFGYGVSAEETYGRKLESILTSDLGRRVRTVNAGMGGFNTVQEAAFLEHQAAAIDPDVVSLLYLPNDIDSNDPTVQSRGGHLRQRVEGDTHTAGEELALQTRRLCLDRARAEAAVAAWDSGSWRERVLDGARQDRRPLPAAQGPLRDVLLPRARGIGRRGPLHR